MHIDKENMSKPALEAAQPKRERKAKKAKAAKKAGRAKKAAAKPKADRLRRTRPNQAWGQTGFRALENRRRRVFG